MTEQSIISIKKDSLTAEPGNNVRYLDFQRQDSHGQEKMVSKIIMTGLGLLVVLWYSALGLQDRFSAPAQISLNHKAPITTHVPTMQKVEWRSMDSSPVKLLYHHEHDLNADRSSDDMPIKHLRNPAYEVKAYRGAVATENEACSRMGVNVMEELGGNAVDAAISAVLCLGVANLFSSGIGGGGFMVVRIPPPSRPHNAKANTSDQNNASQVWTLNFRETAPALSNKTMYQHDPMASRVGGLAVGVPGEIRGLQEAHKRWGTIPWRKLVEPCAKLAAGWKVQKELARRIQMFGPQILNDSDWRPVFAPNGVLLMEGDWVNRTNYSRTLSIIAEQGPDAFYEGPIADGIIDKIRRKGGILSHDDLKSYRIRVEKPLIGSYRGRRLYTTPAPGGGTLLLQMLNVLEHYDMSERTPVNVHRLVETMKFAFASRTKMSDPLTLADTLRMSNLTSRRYALEIFHNITDDSTHPSEYYHPEFDIPIDRGTTHISVVDKNEMAVSLTTTVNSVFGSFVLDPVTGILFNDEMDDFAVPGVPNDFGLYPSPYNYPEPGRIPVSSTSPAILENSDGSLYTTIGGSGGGRIFPSVVQVLLNLDWGMDASEAVEFGRVHDQLYPSEVEADETYPKDAIDYLRKVGHNVSVADINRIAAVVQVIVQKNGIYYAASDSRKNGVAVGY